MVVHHWPRVLPLNMIKTTFLKKSYVACTHESTNSHEVIPSKQDSTTTYKVSGCHPFSKRLREPRLDAASFAHGGYTNQASFLLEISIIHYGAANPAKLKQQLSKIIDLLSLQDSSFSSSQLMLGL